MRAKVELEDDTVERHAPFRLEDFLPYRLSVLTNRISKAFARSYSERFGVSIPEWRVMAVVGGHAPLSSNRVCELTEMDKATVSRAIGRLTSKGLVKRKTNPLDQRLIMLALTRKGQKVYDSIVPLALELEADLKVGLTREEQRVLSKVIDKLNTRVETTPGSETRAVDLEFE